jgi:mono/diheme cytochrome c family protein
MIKGLMHPHVLFVSLFLLIYLIKTILLLSDKDELLEKFKKKTRIAEMIISFGFLVTGIILLILIPSALNTYMIIKLVLVFASIPLAVIGFKKKNKILASLSFFFIVVSFSIAYKVKDGIKSEVTTTSLNGKEIFEKNCVLCHGNNGKLGLSGAKDLSVTQLSHAGIVEIITNGKTPMAAYKDALTAEQIEAVASYIETDLKGK